MFYTISYQSLQINPLIPLYERNFILHAFLSSFNHPGQNVSFLLRSVLYPSDSFTISTALLNDIFRILSKSHLLLFINISGYLKDKNKYMGYLIILC